jgi:uncharacterized repeat protein (TIGR01451 family)
VRQSRLGGGILLIVAGLWAASVPLWGQADKPVPIAATSEPRPLNLDDVARPLPPKNAEVIAVAGPGVPQGSAPANSPIRRVVYQPADPPPPDPTPPVPLDPPSAPAGPRRAPDKPAALPPNTLPPPPPSGGLLNGLAGEAAPAPSMGPQEPTPAPTAPAAPPPAPAVPSVPAAPSARAGGSVAVEVVGPQRANPGEPVPYEIMVRNTGTASLAQVRIELPAPAGARVLLTEPPAQVQDNRLAWALGPLEASGERRLQVEVQAVAPGELHLTPTAIITPGEALRTAVARPPVAILASGTETAAVGAPVAFRVEVTNQSEGPLRDVQVYVQIPAGLFQRQAAAAAVPGPLFTDAFTLPAGEGKAFPLEMTAARTGRWPVVVWLARQGEQPLGLARAVVHVTEPPLAVRIEGPRQATPGRDLDVKIEVANPNAVAAANVRVVQSVPQGLEVVAATAGAAPVPGGQAVQWTLGTLAAGHKQLVACRMRPRAAGDWPLYAVAVGENATEARASHTVHIDGAPPLTLEVLARDGVLPAGAESVCEVRVSNPADLPATNVRVSARLPEELEALPAQGPTAAQAQGTQVAFEPLPQLAPHADAVYRIGVRARRPGPGRIQVEMRADQLARPIVAETGHRVQEDPLRALAAPATAAPRQ